VKNYFEKPEKLSFAVLESGLAVVAFAFAYIIVCFCLTPKEELLFSMRDFYAMYEAAVMSFAIVVCGAVVIDISVKYDKSN